MSDAEPGPLGRANQQDYLDLTSEAKNLARDGDLDGARECLDRAWAAARTMGGWVWIACHHESLLHDGAAVEACLQKCIAAARNAEDWIALCDFPGFRQAPDRVRDCLRKAQDLEPTSLELTMISRLWEELGDRSEACVTLEAAELLARTSLDWQQIAIHWKRLGEKDSMLDAIWRGEKRVDSWRELAGYLAWLWNLDPELADKAARRCLFGFAHADWLTAAAIHFRLQGNLSDAIKCCARAERLASSIPDLCRLATVWHEVEKPDRTAHCLEEAEQKAVTTEDWIEIADCRLKLDQPEEERDALQRAESCASNPWSWFRLGDTLEDRGDEQGRTRCRARLLQAKGTVAEWCAVANSWLIRQDFEMAQKAYERALGGISTCHDHLAMADYYDRSLRDSTRAREHLRAAEETCSTWGEWLFAARVWRDQGNTEKERSCIARAELLARSLPWDVDIWIKLAEAWDESGSVEGQNRCVIQIHEESATFEDWAILAEYWRRHHNPEKWRSCIQRAMKLATRSGHWVALAEAGYQASDNEILAACMQHAEELASHPIVLYRLAEHWDSMGEEKSARRCRSLITLAGLGRDFEAPEDGS